MSYQIKTIKAGNITVVKKYHCFKHQEPGTKRRIKENITPEAKQKLNISNAVDRLYYRLCANFTEDDKDENLTSSEIDTDKDNIPDDKDPDDDNDGITDDKDPDDDNDGINDEDEVDYGNQGPLMLF